MTELSATAVRPQPIRDAIVAYLTEPRFARDIAQHIKRPVPTTTGHLAAMRRRGLVKRIGQGVYALADCTEGPPAATPVRPGPPPAARRSVARLLTQPRSVEALCQQTALPRAEVEAALNSLWLSGLAAGDARDGYCLTAAGRHAYSASAPTVRIHLAALRRQDLINCAGHGVHAHSGSQAVVSVSQPARGEATRALCARIAPLLTWCRSVQGLSLETGLRKADIAAALDGLCRLGLVSGGAASFYRLTAAGARKYAFRASTDAMPHLSHAEAVLPRAVRRASG